MNYLKRSPARGKVVLKDFLCKQEDTVYLFNEIDLEVIHIHGDQLIL